jgi:hypothetical protein
MNTSLAQRHKENNPLEGPRHRWEGKRIYSEEIGRKWVREDCYWNADGKNPKSRAGPRRVLLRIDTAREDESRGTRNKI